MATDGRYPPGHEEEAAFDAFLDDLVQGNEATRGRDARRTDPALVESARRFHALALTRGAPALDSDARASIWEEIMGQGQTATLDSIAPGHPLESGPPSQPGTVSTRSAHQIRWPVTELAVAAVVLLIIVTGYAAWRGEQGPPTDQEVSGPAAFQGATPAVGTPETGFIVPDADECRVEPRSFASIIALAATPSAGTPAAPPFNVSSLPVVGETASAETIAAITDTVRQLYACLETGDELRAYALFTEHTLGQLLQRDLSAPEALVTGLGPREAFDVQEIRMLPDGRVAAKIAFRVPVGVFTETWIFESQDGQYLLDGVVRQGGG